MFGVSSLPMGRCSQLGVAGFRWVVLECSFGGSLSSVPSGSGVWPSVVVWVGSFVAVGLSRPPPLFAFWGGSACSSLCLPWAGARTDRHSVWLTGLLLVLALC